MNIFLTILRSYKKAVGNQEQWFSFVWRATVICFSFILAGIVAFSWYQYIWVTGETATSVGGKTIRTGITMAELDAIKAEHEAQKRMFEEAQLFEEPAPMLK